MKRLTGTADEPLEVTVFRGKRVDCRHEVDFVIADPNGKIVAARGNAGGRIFPRSAIKALQALPLVESGAADEYAFDEKHLALACASHSGEPIHVEAARYMLSAAGNSPADLGCGAHPPLSAEAGWALAAANVAPTQVHNNCSGKHAGFLAFARHSGFPLKNYVALDHPVQKAVADVLASVSGIAHDKSNAAIDGCSIPTFAIPLADLAGAFAKLAAGRADNDDRGRAMTRLRDACMHHPHMVQGTGRFDTVLMQTAPGRIFAKNGAEGVLVCALPEEGLGIALKCRDGAGRAAQAALAFILRSSFEFTDETNKALKDMEDQQIRNWNGLAVAKISVAPTV